MKTKTINLYSFDELSEKAKDNAVQSLSDINVDFGWWEGTYDDALNIGLQITSFDASYKATGKFTKDFEEVIKLILENHGENCDTYKLQKSMKKKRKC